MEKQMKSCLVILRREYLDLLGETADKDLKVKFCAAKLLEYFRHWCSWVQKVEGRPWYYRKLREIHQDLMGEHSLHVIRDAIAWLLDLKFLTRSNNDNGQDRVYRYQIAQSFLVSDQNFPDSDRNFGDSAVETQTINPYKDSSFYSETTTNPVVVGEKEEYVPEPEKEQRNELTVGSKDMYEVEGEEPGYLVEDDFSEPTPVENLDEKKILLEEIRRLCGKMTPKLKMLILRSQLSVVEDAIAAYEEQQNKVKVPVAWMIEAISREYRPIQEASAKVKPIVNPPTKEQMEILQQMKRDRLIHDIWKQPFKEGETFVVYDGRQVIPWWIFLEQKNN